MFACFNCYQLVYMTESDKPNQRYAYMINGNTLIKSNI